MQCVSPFAITSGFKSRAGKLQNFGKRFSLRLSNEDFNKRLSQLILVHDRALAASSLRKSAVI